MAGAHIDTRYIQTDKQQFTTLLSETDKHIMEYLISSTKYFFFPLKAAARLLNVNLLSNTGGRFFVKLLVFSCSFPADVV